MSRSVRQRRVMAAAEALAEALAEADLKPSEMLDVGAALDRGCHRLATRANAMDQLAQFGPFILLLPLPTVLGVIVLVYLVRLNKKIDGVINR